MRRNMRELKATWDVLSVYEKFEQIIALLLTLFIAIIIAVALVDLARQILPLAVAGALSSLHHRTFQTVFGQIMTVLIALEFKHSILRVMARRENIIQVRTVLLIALLAIARKFVILDSESTSPDVILALAAVVVALSIGYWLVQDADYRGARRAARPVPAALSADGERS